MVRYLYGALRSQGINDDVINAIVKALNKEFIKRDLDEKEVTFVLEFDGSKVKVRDIKIWEPSKEAEGFEFSL